MALAPHRSHSQSQVPDHAIKCPITRSRSQPDHAISKIADHTHVCIKLPITLRSQPPITPITAISKSRFCCVFVFYPCDQPDHKTLARENTAI